MEKAPTQCERVLQYIEDFGSVTRVQAMLDLGIANLPAVIDVLRNKMGYKIVTDEIESKNRYGQKVTYAQYRLEKDLEQLSLF